MASRAKFIRFRAQVLPTSGIRLKTFNALNKTYINISHPNIILHPPIVYNTDEFDLEIGLAPFVLLNNDGSLTLSSIALEDHIEILPPIYSGLKVSLLDSLSVLFLDANSNRIFKIFTPSMGEKGFKQISVRDNVPSLVSVHNLNDYAIALANNGYLYQLSLDRYNLNIEPLYLCQVYTTVKLRNFTTSICQYDSEALIYVGNNIYTSYTKLATKFDRSIDGPIYGYISGNIVSVRLGHRNIIYKLDEPEHIVNLDTININPIAMINDDEIIGISTNNATLCLYRLNSDEVYHIAGISSANLKDLYVDLESGNTIITYGNSVYVFNLSTGRITYLSIKTNDVYLALSIDDLLVVFRKPFIDFYRIDLTSTRIYLEKLLSIPRHVISCAGFGENSIICIDEFNRLIIGDPKELFLNYKYKALVLRYNEKYAPYLPSDIMSAHSENLFSHFLEGLYSMNSTLVSTRFIDIHNAKSPITTMYTAPALRVYAKAPHKDDYRIAIVAGKALLIGNSNRHLTKKTYFLSAIDGDSIIRKSLYVNTEADSKFIDALRKELVVYISEEFNNIVWGFSISKKSISIVDFEDILTIDKDRKSICISKKLGEALSIADKLNLIVLCSNTVLDEGRECVHIELCERLLKILLKTVIGGKAHYISLPLDPTLLFQSLYTENPNVSIEYNHGKQLIKLPSRCTKIDNAYLTLDSIPVLNMCLSNQCIDVGSTVILKNSSTFLPPNHKRCIEIRLDVSDIISDGGINLLILESNGIILRYLLPISLQQVIAKAYAIALKMYKILGVKDTYRLHSDVHKSYAGLYKENPV